MKPTYHLIRPDDLHWLPSNLVQIPNANYLERTGTENLDARLCRLPARSANTLHKHIRAEKFIWNPASSLVELPKARRKFAFISFNPMLL